uniref:Putative secreted peptide n=1 Tax=Anopheles braziliensis TaxID=58242 RepID=A0A2M3ZQ43_9DIPT
MARFRYWLLLLARYRILHSCAATIKLKHDRRHSQCEQLIRSGCTGEHGPILRARDPREHLAQHADSFYFLQHLAQRSTGIERGKDAVCDRLTAQHLQSGPGTETVDAIFRHRIIIEDRRYTVAGRLVDKNRR